jgi:hypothetical protein
MHFLTRSFIPIIFLAGVLLVLAFFAIDALGKAIDKTPTVCTASHSTGVQEPRCTDQP